MVIGVVGDFHFPERSRKVPEWIWEKLAKCSAILSSGDFTSREILQRLSSIAPLHAVRGNMDFLDLPLKRRVEIGGWGFGIFHGSGIHPRGDVRQMYDVANQLDVQVLVHGHTHRLDIQIYNGILFLNPGSACGVWSGGGIQTPPSMILCQAGEEFVAEGLENDIITQRHRIKKGGKVPEDFRAQE